ncbi:hypothetical protein LTR86_004991 [Recurvomyces mirabilis]|nr:hypothetical protein LTR86_004991 [Recurvomyces mirabilis]
MATSGDERAATALHKSRRPGRHQEQDQAFLALRDDAPLLPDQPSPASDSPGPTQTSRSLLIDIDASLCRSQHAASPQSLWARLSSFLDPDPYSSQRSSHAGDATVPDLDGNSDRHESYVRKKHRAMAKLELSDALAVRNRVMVALIAWSLLALCLIVYAVRRMYLWVVA